MLLLYYTSTVLLSLSFKANNDRLLQSMDTYDRTHLSSYVCIANCMQRKTHYSSSVTIAMNVQQSNNTAFHECVEYCDVTNIAQTGNYKTIRKVQENYHLDLVCRDDSTLNFRVNLYALNKTGTNATMMAQNGKDVQIFTIYVVKLHIYNNAEKYFIFLSDVNFFTFDKLLSNTLYNITTMAVHSSKKYSIIAKQQQFRTLRRGYIPNNITDIKVTNFTLNYVNGMHLIAAITWKPGKDMTCFYDIICFSPENENYDLHPWEIRNPQLLYTYQVENLSFSTTYKIGIRAKSTKGIKESELYWKSFRTPTCEEWFNYNFNICEPLPPQNLSVQQIYVAYNTYGLNVSWSLPQHLPDNYTLMVYDLSSEKLLKTINLSKETCNIYISNITITGMLYEVSVTAFTLGGRATTTFTDFITTRTHMSDDPLKKMNSIKLLALLLALIFCLAVLAITVFVLYQRRLRLKHYQQRCEYLEKIGKVAITTSNMNGESNPQVTTTTAFNLQYQLDLKGNVQSDDGLKIASDNLKLFEVLGEGAFGVVRRALYKDEKTGIQREVAVKMLKTHPSVDDVRALLQEIGVMRSVGKHPNIVSIIGYNIRHYTQMMLLTEYCSFGSLLSFLRAEWRYLCEQKQKQHVRSGYKLMMQQFETKLPGIPELEEDYELITRNKNIANSDYKTDSFQLNTKEEHDVITSTEKTTAATIMATYASIPCLDKIAVNSVLQNGDYLEKDEGVSVSGGRQRSKLEKKHVSYFQGNQQKFKKNIRLKSMAVENKAYFNLSYKQIGQQKPPTAYLSAATRRPLATTDLLNFARQIAVGMEFLAKHKVVHRDLAARNILIAADYTAKIADFGLSRDIYHENVYKKVGNGKLPIKWLALESLTHQIYTNESWSYGILLYEIVTLGSAPYPAVTTSRLLNFLKAGHRMEKPKHCTQEIYDLMYSCWHELASQRPTFAEIIKTLDKLTYHSNIIDDIKLKMKRCPPRSPFISRDRRYLKPL
ncbi:tyrosine protein kinase receptor torso isoform 1-T4 [Glossina fuscipes fuscipes]